LCQIKQRSESARFSRQTSITYLTDPYQAFNDDERKSISQFCIHLGLEFGSLDVLRDKNDGKIYIVDANNTPHGPDKLSKKEKRLAIRILGEAFKNEYLTE
jgi:hypothetical protein